MSQTTEQSIEIAGKNLVYEAPNDLETGPGHVVLLVHGASFDRRYWNEVLAGLAEKHRPISIDNPGHGSSTGSPYTSADKGSNVLNEPDQVRRRLF